MDLSISNVFNISVSEQGLGLGKYNTSNVAIMSDEDPGTPFADGYNRYLNPTQVGIDFGTDSKTYKLAQQIFNQAPNILANGGELIIIPLIKAKQSITPSAVPASGQFILSYLGNQTAPMMWNDTSSAIQAQIRLLPGLESVTVSGSMATSLVVTFAGAYGTSPSLVNVSDTLEDAGSSPITLVLASSQVGEELIDCFTRTKGLIYYFGMFASFIVPQADQQALAAAVQSEFKMAFFASRSSADIEPGGKLDLIQSLGYNHSRGLYYGSTTDIQALLFMAGYVGRGLSTVFSGNKTTQNMHLKSIKGIEADPTMTQVLLGKAQAAGVDTYPSIQTVAKVFTSGKNFFFDQVYNLLWFIGDLQIAGFNILATNGTKIAQTEDGVLQLTGAYRKVAEQAVTNEYAAPGEWDRPDTFGNQADFLANIRQRGYYIYTPPVSQQEAADRAARKAPVCQIALKESGAINSGSIIININK